MERYKMRKLIASGIVCSALILTSGIASAGSMSATSTGPANWFSNFYLGTQLGYAETNYHRNWLTRKTGFTSVREVESKDYAARFFLGYSFNQFFSLESGWVALQGIKFKDVNGSGTDPEMNQTIIDFVGKATLPIGYIGLFVKGGGAYIHRTEIRVTNARYYANNKYIPAVGAGLSVFISPNVTLGAEYDRYISSGDFERTDFFSVSGIYQFS